MMIYMWKFSRVTPTGVAWYECEVHTEFIASAAAVRCSAFAMARGLFPWGFFRKPLYIQVRKSIFTLVWSPFKNLSMYVCMRSDVTGSLNEWRCAWLLLIKYIYIFFLFNLQISHMDLEVIYRILCRFLTMSHKVTWCSTTRQDSTILLISVTVATTSMMHLAGCHPFKRGFFMLQKFKISFDYVSHSDMSRRSSVTYLEESPDINGCFTFTRLD